MPWPSEVYRGGDFSWYQNKGIRYLYKPFDVEKFLDANPDLDFMIIRCMWPGGKKDQHYDYYYDEFTAAGKIVLAYGWPNLKKTVAAVVEDWKRALGDRIPPALFRDWEEASGISPFSPSQITANMRALHKEMARAFPAQRQAEYARGHWLDSHVKRWADTEDEDTVNFDDLEWWLAHWIYPPSDYSDQAKGFYELDPLLPIDNNFTPNRGRVVKILEERNIGWQASSRFIAGVPNGTWDGDYLPAWWLDEVAGTEPDDPEEPPPPTEKGIVTVSHDPNKTDVRVEEIHG